MKKINRFENLDCWKASRALANKVYDLAETGLLSKDYIMKDQFIRAGISTMNNIAEGFGRKSNKEFIRYLEMSQSSGQEIRSMLYLLSDRKYITQECFESMSASVNEHINLTLRLIRYLAIKEQ